MQKFTQFFNLKDLEKISIIKIGARTFEAGVT